MVDCCLASLFGYLALLATVCRVMSFKEGHQIRQENAWKLFKSKYYFGRNTQNIESIYTKVL
jgi:hypothetical protein